MDEFADKEEFIRWRNDIGGMTEYVLRSADEFDGGIMDTTYPLTAEVDVVQNFAGWSIEANPSGCYVIGVVCAEGLTEYYWINDYEIDDFGAAMFGNTLWTNIVADDPGIQQGGVPSFMKAQFNPLQYVVSCMWFPGSTTSVCAVLQSWRWAAPFSC